MHRSGSSQKRVWSGKLTAPTGSAAAHLLQTCMIGGAAHFRQTLLNLTAAPVKPWSPYAGATASASGAAQPSQIVPDVSPSELAVPPRAAAPREHDNT